MQIIAYSYTVSYRSIGLMSRVFASGPGDRGSVPGQVIQKTQKVVLDSAWLNAQHYKVRIKGKVEQSWEWSIALPYTFGVVSIQKGTLEPPLTKVANFTYFIRFQVFQSNIKNLKTSIQRRIFCVLVTKVLDREIEVCLFKLQLCYYVHFRTNTLRKVMKPLIPPQLCVK